MSVTIRQTGLEGVIEITPKKWMDQRGFFSETYNAAALTEHGVNIGWVQDNHSYSIPAGVLRGLHYQKPPFAQDKLVRVPRGRILDVVVDIRRGSPTYRKWVAIEVSSDKWNQVLVPRGFAHGLLTLEPHTEVLYKVSAVYSPEHDASIRYDDPAIGVEWPLDGVDVILSGKDTAAPLLKDQDPGFEYGEAK